LRSFTIFHFIPIVDVNPPFSTLLTPKSALLSPPVKGANIAEKTIWKKLKIRQTLTTNASLATISLRQPGRSRLL
jgi:hypothetical protein